jgi:hypothetical protein
MVRAVGRRALAGDDLANLPLDVLLASVITAHVEIIAAGPVSGQTAQQLVAYMAQISATTFLRLIARRAPEKLTVEAISWLFQDAVEAAIRRGRFITELAQMGAWARGVEDAAEVIAAAMAEQFVTQRLRQPGRAGWS